MVGEVILQQLTTAGCTVIAADSGTDLTADTDDPTRRLIRQVLGAVAEFDRRVTVMKLCAARERKRSRGERCEGRKPFGTFPGELETLVRIRELRRKPPNGRRRSLQQVCDALNGEGRPTRSGKPWTKQVVSRILCRQPPQTVLK
jgi:DNA invertase Pin-like site-specific DNA recombinase